MRTLVFSLALLVPAIVSAQTLPNASQIAGQIQAGWNLGNTMEAQCGETAWGNPMVNQQLINAVKAAGFNAIRIPAAWDCHADQTTLTIDAAWMARVKQVVDYAYNQGMYVILNIHWDGGWLEEHPLYSYQAAVNQKQRAYWTQIANTFKNYNERLLFAGTNEVHADYGTPTDRAHYRAAVLQPDVRGCRARDRRQQHFTYAGGPDLQHEHVAWAELFLAADGHHREPVDRRGSSLRSV